MGKLHSAPKCALRYIHFLVSAGNIVLEMLSDGGELFAVDADHSQFVDLRLN